MRLYADQVDAVTGSLLAAPAQVVPAPGVEAVSEREFKQFLSDVVAAAGLVTHGNKCKDLGRRLGEMSMRLLTAPKTAAAPSATPHAELRKTWREGQRWQTRGDPTGQWLDTVPCWYPDQEYRRHPDDFDAAVPAQSAPVDAERYRWLFDARTKSQAESISGTINNPLPQDVVLSHLQGFFMHKAQVDEMIDAAMAAQEKP